MAGEGHPRWIEERRGRIAASVPHRVAKRNIGTASPVAGITGYVKMPQVAHLRWSSQAEQKAVQAFGELASPKHIYF